METIPKDLILEICGFLDDTSKLNFLSVASMYDKFKSDVKFNSWLDVKRDLWYVASFDHFKMNYNGNTIIKHYEHLMIVTVTDSFMAAVPDVIKFECVPKRNTKSLTWRVILKLNPGFDISRQVINFSVCDLVNHYLKYHHIKFNLEYVFDDKFNFVEHNVVYQIIVNSDFISNNKIVPGKIYSVPLIS